MLIAAGSLNRVKIEAVKEAFKEFGFTIDIKYHMAQPLSLEETVRGAIYRAKAIDGADYRVDIEAGLINVLGYHLNIQVAAIIKDDIYLGLAQHPNCLRRLRRWY